MLSDKQRNDIACDVYSLFFTNSVPIDSIEVAAIRLGSLLNIKLYVVDVNWNQRKPEYTDMHLEALAKAIQTVYFHSVEIVNYYS